jgi:hypothetical protein
VELQIIINLNFPCRLKSGKADSLRVSATYCLDYGQTEQRDVNTGPPGMPATILCDLGTEGEKMGGGGS